MKGKSTRNGAVLLNRVSTDEQGKGYSLETQLEKNTAFAHEQGLQIKATHSSPESSWDATRPTLDAAIASCLDPKNKVKALIVCTRDRLARDPLEALEVEQKLWIKGIVVFSATETATNIPTWEGYKARHDAYLAAAVENIRRGDSTSKGMSARVKAGLHVCRVPYPYKISDRRGDTDKPGFLDKTPINDAGQTAADLYRKAFSDVANGLKSIRAVMDDVNKLGDRNLGWKPLNKSTFSKALRNPYFYGKIVWNTDLVRKGRKNLPVERIDYSVIGDGIHEPLVTETLWRKVQRVLDGGTVPDTSRSSILRKNFTPLARLIRCPGCRTYVRGDYKPEKGLAYYDCQNDDCIGPLKFKGQGKKMHPAFLRLLESQAPSPEFIAIFKLLVVEAWKQQDKERKARISEAERRLEAAKAEIPALIKTAKLGIFSVDDLKADKKVIDARIWEAETDLMVAKSEGVVDADVIEYGLTMLNSLAYLWESSDLVEKRLLNAALFPDGLYWVDGNYRTTIDDDSKADTVNVLHNVQLGSANGNRTRI